MTYKDKEKLARLRHTFDLNYRVTELYATYLERFPEFITSEMINELTSDGRITAAEAVGALLSTAFMLDDANGSDERKLIRDYINPSVKILDANKYLQNKYYKNIKIEEVKDGAWEIKKERYAPFRGVICGDMSINSDFSEVPPLGFFTEEFCFPAVLENGNEWMTLTPVDLDTCEDAIRDACGRVITFGLGLGYYAYMVSEKEDVESITVIEKSEDVIRLFKKHILPQFSNPEKVIIICSDAFEYAEKEMPKMDYDYAFVDTWRDASDGLPMYEKMKSLEHLSPKTSFSYWIERFIISRRRAFKFEELYSMVMRGAEGAPDSYEDFLKELTEGEN